jgi:DHA2 family multidrug resistance protein
MKTDLDIKPLIGLAGVLIMAMASEFNDQVSSAAIADVLGGLHLSHDTGTWIQSLYVSAEVMGMLLAPWSAMTFSSRRFILFVISLNAVSTLLIPTTTSISAIYGLRILQGFAGGLSIPLLMATALRFLSPSIRVYGLACYALTATFTPYMAPTITALWVDVVGWHFVFLQAIPLCVSAGILAWFGLPQDPMMLDRLKRFDWRGVLLALVGLGSLSTLLQQGDRLDWFNSPAICLSSTSGFILCRYSSHNSWRVATWPTA